MGAVAKTYKQVNPYVMTALMVGSAMLFGGCQSGKGQGGNGTIAGNFLRSLTSSQAYPGDPGPSNVPTNIEGGYISQDAATVEVGGDGKNIGGPGIKGIDKPLPALRDNSGKTVGGGSVTVDASREGVKVRKNPGR